MSDSIDPLLRDFLIWLGENGRPYPDVMDAWRTSCPRLPVWEDANDRGFVVRTRIANRDFVQASAAGRAFMTQDSVHSPH